MNSKERMVTAIWNKKPDMVPVAPDISNMIPCRLTGKPFWDIYMNGKPTLFEAYLNAVKYFKFDGWFIYGGLNFKYKTEVSWEHTIISMTTERIVRRVVAHTSDGDLDGEQTLFIADSPTSTKKMIKDLTKDFKKFRHFFQEPVGYNADDFKKQNELIGNLGANSLTVGLPGFPSWVDYFKGGIETLTYLHYDRPDLLEELKELHHKMIIKQTEMNLQEKPDFLFISFSGAITLQSPELFRHYSLPTMKVVTKMAKEAGIPTMMHSCGKEYALCKMAVEETDLNCINPLEIHPMGDCDLGRIKHEFGHKLALMGNLHTTEVMLRGTPQDVACAAKGAIDAAAGDGGFILSTGDQCGRDTPDENIFAMVETARTYGKY